MKHSFLSVWTVLLLTLATFALGWLGLGLLTGSAFGGVSFNTREGWALLALCAAILVYGFAWFAALLDALHERGYVWVVLLIVLAISGLAPLVYSIAGSKHTR